MKALLFVLNAREIPEALDSFRALDVDLLWSTGHTMTENVLVHADVVDRYGDDYDVILNVSDDCVVSQEALDAVLGLLEGGALAATGWCRIYQGKETVNVCKTPLRGEHPHHLHYDFYLRDEVLGYPEPVVPTHFMGMSVTGMPVAMWRTFPFGCFEEGRNGRGKSSDFHLCRRLRDAGIPMVTHRDAEVIHLKRQLRDPFYVPQPFILGNVPQTVTHDPVEARSMDSFVNWLEEVTPA